MAYELNDVLGSISQRATVDRWGIGVASQYVKSIYDGSPSAELAKLGDSDRWSGEVAGASQRLTYCDDEMGVKSFSDGTGITAGSILEYDCVLSSRRRDRDGDILEPKGMEVDLKMPLLWQHLQMQPIGKHVAILSQDESFLKCKFAIADIPLGRDAATLVKFGALRKSHGFKPVPGEFEPVEILKNAKGEVILNDKGQPIVKGWHVKRATVYEGSLVSIPSNADGNMLRVYEKQFDGIATAFSRDLLHDPLVKCWAKGLYDKRPVIVPGFSDEMLIKGAKDQPRVPAGSSAGGQFASTSGGGGSGSASSSSSGSSTSSSSASSSVTPLKLRAGKRVNIDEAARVASSRGYKLGAGNTEPINGKWTTTYKLTDSKGKEVTVEASALRKWLQKDPAKAGDPPEHGKSFDVESNDEPVLVVKADGMNVTWNPIACRWQDVDTKRFVESPEDSGLWETDDMATKGASMKCPHCGTANDMSGVTDGMDLSKKMCSSCGKPLGGEKGVGDIGTKAGRAISAANEERLRKAKEAIESILDNAGLNDSDMEKAAAKIAQGLNGDVVLSGGKSIIDTLATKSLGAIATKSMWDDEYGDELPGSYESISSKLSRSAMSYLMASGVVDAGTDGYCRSLATFPTEAIVCCRMSGGGSYKSRCFRIAYSIDDAGTPKFTGTPTEVEVKPVVMEKALAALSTKSFDATFTPASPTGTTTPPDDTITTLARKLAGRIITADGPGGEVKAALDTVSKAFTTLKQAQESFELESLFE